MATKGIPEDTDSVNYRTVHLKFSNQEIAAIDAWQAAQKIRTRSEAIRQMIQQTLRATAAFAEPRNESELHRVVREVVLDVMRGK